MSELHLDHVRAHVSRLRDGYVAVADPEGVFLGMQTDEGFDELIALRLAGMRRATLAAFRFHRQALPGISFARESLASYLTNPPRNEPTGRYVAPLGRIPVLLPRDSESIATFLTGLRAGRETPSLALDPGQVRVAFDFRGHNPSALGVLKQGLRHYVLRTTDGHVLTGRSSSLGSRQGSRFVALGDARQILPQGRLRLPELILDASWIGLWADVTEDAARHAATQWAPFTPAEASPDVVIGVTAAAATTPPASPSGRTPGGVAAG